MGVLILLFPTLVPRQLQRRAYSKTLIWSREPCSKSPGCRYRLNHAGWKSVRLSSHRETLIELAVGALRPDGTGHDPQSALSNVPFRVTQSSALLRQRLPKEIRANSSESVD